MVTALASKQALVPVDSAGDAALIGDELFDKTVVLVRDVKSAPAEALRALRNNLLSQHVDRGRRALALCSPSEGVGCTLTAVNLAVGMAQVGVNTLLIDANLRTGSVDKLIKAPHSTGLLQCLTLDETLSGAVVRDLRPNLSVLFSGGVAAEAQDLLAGQRFARLLQSAMRDYDLTILDTPPANICGDAPLVAGTAGYAMLIAREERTFVNDLSVLLEQLRAAQVSVVGSVLNKP